MLSALFYRGDVELIQCRFYIPVVAVRGRLWQFFAKKTGAWWFSCLQFTKSGV